MVRRPISAQTRQWLTTELETWHAAGILDFEQTRRILDSYETVEETADRKHSRGLFVLSSLAVFMIGLAVLLLVGYNWEGMSATVKLTILFGSLLGAYAGAFWLRFRTRLTEVSEVLFFLGGLLYGVNIWQIAQIFHIQSHYPDGIWYWAVGVLPLALCLDTLLMHALYAGLLGVWVGVEILGFDTPMFWWSFSHGAYSLPLLVVPSLLWAYRKQSAATVALYVSLLAWWAILQPVAWQWNVNPVYFIGLAGALLLTIAEWHPLGSCMAKPYRFFGVAMAAGTIVPLSFASFIIDLQHGWCAGHASGYVPGLVIGLVGAVAAFGTILLQSREVLGKRSNARVSLALLRRQWLPLSITALMTALCLWNAAFQSSGYTSHYGDYVTQKWTPPVFIPALVVNVMMIVLALWLMRVGLREEEGRLFTAGVFYFLLWAVLRYIDLFGGVGGMLGASLMFLLCGVGLLAVVRFWHKRKETVHV
jgi:uncharacterized membrane protein